MPKQVYSIKGFAGLNTEADARDIKDNELVEAIDIMVDKPGKIRMMGDASNGSYGTEPNVTVVPGYGLFTWSADYDWTPTNAETDYVLLQDDNLFKIWDGVNNAWKTQDTDSNNLDMGTANGGDVYPCYYVVDGAIRICDGNFTNTQMVSKWLGYIDRTHFYGTNGADVYAGWYRKDQEIAPPTDGVAGILHARVDSGSGTSTKFYLGGAGQDVDVWDAITITNHLLANITQGEYHTISNFNTLTNTATTDALNSGAYSADICGLFPPAGTGFNFSFGSSAAGDGGDFQAGTYEFASSFIYDDCQESLLYRLDGTYEIADNDSFLLVYIHASAPYNPRITGGRLYFREYGSDDDWVFLADISLVDGARKTTDSEFASWNDYCGAGYYELFTSILTCVNISATTYEMLSGISKTENDIHAKYKTACIANRRAYIGNVFQDFEGSGTDIHYGDRMIKSPVNKFDTFPASNYIDVAINDGDDIVKLVSFADRILQFKKRHLYIINVSEDIEYLEATHKYMGIEYPCQVCETPNGVVWANEKGCHIYTGEKTITLTDKIKDEWQSEIDESNIVAVGYDELNDIILVKKGCDGVDGDVYLCDMKTGAWTFGDSKITDSHDYTNFINTSNGTLAIYSDTSNAIKDWSDSSASSDTMSIITKDIDFGNPGQIKRVYAVRVTHRESGSSKAEAWYRCVDATAGAFGSWSSLGELTDSDDWVTQEFSVTPSDIYSIQIKIEPKSEQTVPSDFEINDISIIYRTKGIHE